MGPCWSSWNMASLRSPSRVISTCETEVAGRIFVAGLSFMHGSLLLGGYSARRSEQLYAPSSLSCWLTRIDQRVTRPKGDRKSMLSSASHQLIWHVKVLTWMSLLCIVDIALVILSFYWQYFDNTLYYFVFIDITLYTLQYFHMSSLLMVLFDAPHHSCRIWSSWWNPPEWHWNLQE